MKKLKLILLFLIITKLSFSQYSISFNGGFNNASIVYSSLLKNSIPSDIKNIETKSLNSFCFGGLVDYRFNKTLSLQSGLFFTGKGGEISLIYKDIILSNDRITPFYVEMPFNILFNFNKFQIYTGSYLNFGLLGKTTITANIDNYGTIYNKTRDIVYGTSDSVDLRTFNYGLTIGTGYRINNFLFRLQYEIGITKLRINLPPTTILLSGITVSTPPINQTYLLFNSNLTFSIGYVLFEKKNKKRFGRRKY